MTDEQTPIPLANCRKCEKLKVRIDGGMYDARNKKWVDEKGTAWCGRICPDCHRIKMANHMKVKRAEENE